jgi:hypothetical protein
VFHIVLANIKGPLFSLDMAAKGKNPAVMQKPSRKQFVDAGCAAIGREATVGC